MTGKRGRICERRNGDRKDEEKEKARVWYVSPKVERQRKTEMHERIRAQRDERTKEERQSGITRGGSRLSHDGRRESGRKQGRVRAGSEGVTAATAEEEGSLERGKQHEGGTIREGETVE